MQGSFDLGQSFDLTLATLQPTMNTIELHSNALKHIQKTV